MKRISTLSTVFITIVCITTSASARSSTMRGLFGGAASGAVLGGLLGGGRGAGWGALALGGAGALIGNSKDAERRARYRNRSEDEADYDNRYNGYDDDEDGPVNQNNKGYYNANNWSGPRGNRSVQSRTR